MFPGYGQLIIWICSQFESTWWQFKRPHIENLSFISGPEYTETFETIKNITSGPIIKCYDPKKSLTLQRDASLNVFSTGLLQKGHTLFFVSKCLQPHQKAYVTIILESLLVDLGHGEIFSLFIFDWRFELETNQVCDTSHTKVPGNGLFKCVTQATPRFQGLLMRIQLYALISGTLKVTLIRLPDCFSRLGPLQNKIKLLIVQDHEIPFRLQTTACRIQLLHVTTAQDNIWVTKELYIFELPKSYIYLSYQRVIYIQVTKELCIYLS